MACINLSITSVTLLWHQTIRACQSACCSMTRSHPHRVIEAPPWSFCTVLMQKLGLPPSRGVQCYSMETASTPSLARLSHKRFQAKEEVAVAEHAINSCTGQQASTTVKCLAA